MNVLKWKKNKTFQVLDRNPAYETTESQPTDPQYVDSINQLDDYDYMGNHDENDYMGN